MLAYTGGPCNPITQESKIEDLDRWEQQALQDISRGKTKLAEIAFERAKIENDR